MIDDYVFIRGRGKEWDPMAASSSPAGGAIDASNEPQVLPDNHSSVALKTSRTPQFIY